jgi:alkylation response protein AidB-like acyl-CoA dehydrogenase
MDTTLSESEQLIQSQIRELLSKEVTPEVIASVETSREIPSELWGALVDNGWFGIAAEETNGGVGGSTVDWALVAEQMGWFACPGPVVEQLAAVRFLAGKPGALPDPDIVTGRKVLTAALRDKPGTVTYSKQADGGASSVSGVKVLVPYAASSHVMLASAINGGGPESIILESTAQGVDTRTVGSVSRNQQGVVSFSSARGISVGSERPHDPDGFTESYLLAHDAFAVGLLGRALEISVGYVSNRVQFGRPIGTFQAVQHRCADMAIAYYGAQSLMYYTAWLLDQGRPSARALAMCHAFTRDAAGEVVGHAHQVHGAMGFTIEYPLHFFTRRAKVYQHSFGNASAHREQLATLEDEKGDSFWNERVGRTPALVAH